MNVSLPTSGEGRERRGSEGKKSSHGCYKKYSIVFALSNLGSSITERKLNFTLVNIFTYISSLRILFSLYYFIYESLIS
jgi:hypothetical protein